MPLLLTQRARKERVRYVADILKEPSSNRGECPHTIYSSVELLQYDRKNENDGRRFKYVRWHPFSDRDRKLKDALNNSVTNLDALGFSTPANRSRLQRQTFFKNTKTPSTNFITPPR